jgi:hypothetical protein
MQNTIPFHQNNLEYNPLFAKMQERFCAGGTIAERMEKKAAEYMRNNPMQTCGEYHMTHANSLPKRCTEKKKKRFSFKKNLFSMRHISTLCMALLIGGTLAFSGASLSGVVSSLHAGDDLKLSQEATEKNLILDQDAPLHLEEFEISAESEHTSL